MMNTSFLDSLSRTDILPPLTVPRKVKNTDKWKKAVMDSFEHIALKQVHENLVFFDNYRMVDGKMSYQELSEVVPHLKGLENLLDGVGIPTFLKHYDITSIVVNTIVDKYVDLQDKFHVQDTGEVAKNDFLRNKDKQIKKLLTEIVDNYVSTHLAENGLNEEGKQFSSQEEQQQYLQQLEEQRNTFKKEAEEDSRNRTFKTSGVIWGEATLEQDEERFNLLKLNKQSLKDYLTSGRCFREYKIYHDKYQPINWNAKTVFFSKEIELEDVQKGEYVGRILPKTPSECIQEYGHKISAEKQKELLGGNETWDNFVASGVASGTVEQAINSNFLQLETVPFKGYHDYNFMLNLQDELDVPMGIETVFNRDGSSSVKERYLPRMANGQVGIHNSLARLLRDDFIHRKDLCQVTEVYFKAYDLWGYLTYENDFGRVVTEEVTEDILKDFLKDNNIKQTFKQSVHDIVTSFEPGTLKWQYKPVTYYGVKIQSANLSEPLYIDVAPMEHQIKGDSEYDTLLPVAGKIGASVVGKFLPFQAKYNLCMNQIGALIEKELGMVLLMSTDLIPSEYEGWGDAESALMAMRNTAKSVGLMPVNFSLDSQKTMNNANPIQAINISHAQEIASRVQLADFFQKKAYELIGINPILNQPTKYETAEGVRLSNESNVAQISGVHEEFSNFHKGALELHLSVAQYCQSNKKDLSLYYTKSDGSIQFLKMTDPEFPLRRLGMIVTADSKKRKNLETFKSLILNNNTLGADTLELARLIGSDSWSEVVEIANLERKARQDEAEQQQQAQSQQAAQQQQMIDQNNQKEWERQEMSKQKDREARIEQEKIQAMGRAADMKTDPNSMEYINQQANQSLKNLELNHKVETEANNFKLREKQANDARELKIKELELKARELEEKSKSRQSSEFVASINKN